MNPADLIPQLVKLSLVPVGAVARERRPGVTVLGYHRVGGRSGRQLDLPAAVFDWQMAYLRTHCTVVSLDQVARIVQEGTVYPHDVVAVTFDDGYEEVYHEAFPILRRHGLPVTVYLATAVVENRRPFPFEALLPPSVQGRPLSWAQARELQDSGLVTFGAHTHTHRDLTMLSPTDVEHELTVSNELILERLGRAPEHFAYPWGQTSAPARAIVDRFYRTAVVGGTRKNPYGTIDLGALRRVPIQRSDARLFFRLKLGSYLFAEEWVRRPRARHAARAASAAAWPS